MGLNATLKEINKTFGEGSIMMMGEGEFDVETISTGIPQLDLALGAGGFPRGRIMEIYGPESSGKTTTGLYMVAEVQKRGEVAAFVDLENALDPAFARDAVGVDIDKLVIAQPSSAEQALEIVLKLVESGEVSLIVVDSVAALVPRAEIEGDMGDAHMGLVARLMSQAMRRLNALQMEKGSKCTVLFINQLREKIGVMFGNPETTTGGNALKFYSSVRMDARSPESKRITEGDTVIGKHIKITVKKNKVGPPFGIAEFDLMFDGGVDEYAGLLFVAIMQGLINQKGAWFFDSNGEKLAQGKSKTIEYLKENQEYADELRGKLYS